MMSISPVSSIAKITEQNDRNPAKKNAAITGKSTNTASCFADCLTAATEEIMATLIIHVKGEQPKDYNFKKKVGGK